MLVLDRPRLFVDLNNAVEEDLFLLSTSDSRVDSAGNTITFFAGLGVYVYNDDTIYNDDDELDPYIMSGLVGVPPQDVPWAARWLWSCRIDTGFVHLSEALRS